MLKANNPKTHTGGEWSSVTWDREVGMSTQAHRVSLEDY